MFLDPVARNLSGAPLIQYNSVEASRTIPSLLVKTFALRIAVMAAYGHLGTLQGLSENWRTALPRMIVLFVFPGATLAGDFLRNYLSIPMNQLTRTRCRCTICPNREWSWRFLLLSAAGYNIEYQLKTVKNDGMTTWISNIGRLPFCSLSYTPLPWSWDWVLLKCGRLIALSIVLAQAIASLVLVIRRLRVHAALAIDSSNGIYAIIGILSVCHSMILLAIDGELDIRGNGILSSMWTNPHKVTITIFGDIPEPPTTYPWRVLILLQLFCGIGPTQYMQGQVLLNGRSAGPIRDLFWGSLWKSLPITASFYITFGLLVASIGFSVQRLIRRYMRRRRHQDEQTSASLLAKSIHHYAPFGVAVILNHVVNYLLAIGYEIYVIRCGLETKTWGSDKWRWYDPWSDTLFVY